MAAKRRPSEGRPQKELKGTDGPQSSRTHWVILLLILAASAAFGRTLTNGFTYDDFGVLLDNPAVTRFASPVEMLLDPTTHGTGDLTRAYRPLRTFLFACQYAMFGRNPLPYHVVNLLLHMTVTVLAWAFVRRFVPDLRAVVVGVLFACHPLATEVVASVKAQDDLLAAVIMLSGAILFDGLTHRCAEGSLSKLWPLLIVYIVGLLVKESVIILPALLLGVWLVGHGAGSMKHRFRSVPWGLLVPMGCVGLVFLELRGLALAAAQDSSDSVQATWLFPSSVAYIPMYWKLFVWPARLTIDHTDLSFGKAIYGLLLVSIAVQFLVGMLAWRTGNAGIRLGLVWFYITLFPSLNLLTAYFIVAERFAYLPSLGMAIAAAEGLFWLIRNLRFRRPKAALLLGCTPVVLALVLRSAVRCGDWKDNETLYRSALAINPSPVFIRLGLIDELIGEGRYVEAEQWMPDLRQLEGKAPRSGQQRAALDRQGRIALGREDYARAASVMGWITGSPFARWGDWLNYGTALTNLGRYEEARDAFENVLESQPESAVARRMLGRIGWETSDFEDAQHQFEAACRVEPNNDLNWFGQVYSAWRWQGEEAALEKLEEAHARGARLGRWFREDWSEWKDSGQRLREAIEQETAGEAGSP